MVVGEGARLAIVGIAIGLAGAAVATRAIQSQLFETSAIDPLTFVAGAARAGRGGAAGELSAGAPRRERGADRRARPLSAVRVSG